MRTTNLIQSYISGYPSNQQYNSEKAVKDFDVKKELTNRTFIKPLPSNGKLIKPSLFDIPSEIRKDMIYDWRAFRHALKGKANDHELGRLNDVGMKIGGLAIASYLFTKKQTPMTKIFEFIGLGSFFAAMDIWPKLFIQLPAYLVHGFNVRQQYEDSFGRKKMFYQDHQFIPWDLYSDKEINKIGDKLNVPKDMPNRRDFIQEKMRKIALQNNTLWMLTAGFATPIMSALICNMMEKPVANYLSKVKNQKADALIDNFAQEVTKYKFENNKKQLEEIISSNLNKPINAEVFETISENLTDGLDNIVAENLRKDLKTLIPTESKYSINSKNLDTIRTVIHQAYSKLNLSDAEIAKLIPDNESITAVFNTRSLINGDFKDFSEHSKAIQSLLEDRLNILKKENPNHPAIKKVEFTIKKLIHSPEIGADSKLFNAFKQTSATILTPELASSLKEISSIFNNLKAETTVLEKYAFIKAAQAPESGLADSWNHATKKIFKALKFTPEEIKKGRIDREVAGSILRNKIETIAANPEEYKRFLGVVEKELSSLHGRLASLDMSQEKNAFVSHLNCFDDAANALRKFGMQKTIDTLIGFDGNENSTSIKNIMKEFISNRTLGVKSSFYRLLSLTDLYRRVADKKGLKQAFENDYIPREVIEECIELAKSTLLEAHSSDYAVKFWQRRNPAPNMNDFSNIEVKSGKVINKYVGQRPTNELAEISNDREFFKAVMKLMFGSEMHPDTYRAIINSGFEKDFDKFKGMAYDILGGDAYFAKPNHLVHFGPTKSSSLSRFLITGAAPDEMVYKYFNQTFNSGKWFSRFGKIGAILAGLTVFAQFFFGHMKNPKQDTKEVK